jgi:cation transporter-like permease
MTLLDVEELTSYWAEHPPVHVLVAAYLGLNGQKRSRISAKTSSGLVTGTGSDPSTLLAELGPGFASGDVHAGLAPVELDFTELRRKAATEAS